VAVGICAPLIGTFLVQKRLSLIGDGLGHVAFAGVGAGLLAGLSGAGPLWVALVFAVAGALAIEWLRSRRRASGDVALATIFYSGIALGVVLLSLGDNLGAGILPYLFGSPLTVTTTELIPIVAIGVGIVSLVIVARRALFSVATDEDWSRVAGLPADGLNVLLAIVTAAAVVAAMRVVGILLVAAMMVLPVASAQLLARSFAGTLKIAVAIGVAASVVGLVVARVWGLAPSGAIVLLTTAVFVAVGVVRRGTPVAEERA
jgi:zinc transport system permease protein